MTGLALLVCEWIDNEMGKYNRVVVAAADADATSFSYSAFESGGNGRGATTLRHLMTRRPCPCRLSSSSSVLFVGF